MRLIIVDNMFLEKLEIQGFKSFAQKNELAFPGIIKDAKQGLTAIVGPNGSGKSNISDAVRWVLGEQSLKSLRGKKAEDVIFSGTEKKGKLGMAQVSIFLNNSDKSAPIDYTELVITRRIYRDGNSEYLINNSKVRLIDVQMLLARANVGQKTYSVVGQGTVDSFLSSSLADRKEFFDEATGVKQYQIKRDSSLNKLRNSYENLIQAQMLLTEIEPRLGSLTRQVNKLKKRGALEEELRASQLVYYSNIWHEHNNKFIYFNKQYLEIEKEKQEKDGKLEAYNKELEKYEVERQEESEYDILQRDLNKKVAVKESFDRKLAKVDAQLETKLESAGKFDLSFLLNKKEEIDKEIKSIQEEVISFQNSISHDRGIGEELQREAGKIATRISEQNQEIVKISQSRREEKSDESVDLQVELEKIVDELSDVQKIDDLDKVKAVIDRIRQTLKKLFKESEGVVEKQESDKKSDDWQTAHSVMQEMIDEKEKQTVLVNENNLRISARTERVKLLEEKQATMRNELVAIERKIKKNSEEADYSDIKKEQDVLKKEIDDTEKEISEIKNRIGKINREEEDKRSRLLSLQRNIQDLQNEINALSHKLNEIKVQATRFETKLEDIEVKIRDELGSMKDVKDGHQIDHEINISDLKNKISQIKRQLELIGGIDPEIENEYIEIKDRYDYLKGQSDDLEKAIDSLEKVIKELDKVIKEKFDKEFKLIAKKFSEYFKILFNGGTANIEKVIEDIVEKKTEAGQELQEATLSESQKNELNKFADINKLKFLQKHNATGLAGVEINACPPGKKISSVSMLSGGEKALTAIALICAIISNNPSPFVFLDEVDAALDEANSERLARILDDLAGKTQFIVITHNRASMKRASVLYGVTMGDDGVSKLVSVKIDEAADRARY